MKLKISRFAILPITLGVGACGPAAGTQPHEMSVAQHEAVAAQHEKQSAAHLAQNDLPPSVTAASGGSQTREKCYQGLGDVCWTEESRTGPMEGHKSSAEKHSELAAQHRAASQSLRDAEAKTCAGLSAENRDTSPFAHRADILSVSQFREKTSPGESSDVRDAGATIVFRATPGLTAQWLQRIVDCHLARNAAVGHDMPEMTSCPLVPRGAQASVRPMGAGFAVDIHGDDSQSAAEIWRRAQLLSTAH